MNIETIILTLQIVQALALIIITISLYELAMMVYNLSKIKVILVILAILLPIYYVFGSIGVALISLIYATRLLTTFNKIHIDNIISKLDKLRK